MSEQSGAPEQNEGLHVTHDENGRKLPNVKRAGGEFTAEDVRFTKKETPELHAQLQQHAERVLGGQSLDNRSDKLIDRIDRAAVLAELAPEGIKFSAQGRPDFTPHAVEQVYVNNLTGKYDIDATRANEVAGLNKEQWEVLKQDYVWHHVEDGKTMQLIPRELHDAVRHVGGSYVIKNGIEAALTPASEQIMREAYQKQAGYQQDRLSAEVAPSPAVAAAPLMVKPKIATVPQSPAAYTAHIKDGELSTQFSAGDGKGPLGHADFKKDEIGRMVHDPDIKTINGHERLRYAYAYDKAQHEALQRGATPEQAQLAASERTQQVMARVEMAQERAELRQQPYTREVNTHFDKLGQLRDARVQGLEARAKLENREYRGPKPKPVSERQFEARTGAHIFTSYAKLEIYAKRYGYSPKAYQEKKTGLDRSIAEYRQSSKLAHERSLSGFTREPSIDRSFGPELSR